MGACSSCLGFGRRDRGVENSETSRLLYDDPYRPQYGAAGQTRAHHYQQDPESLRRETEALEGICHDMSDDVVDVSTLAPQSGQANSSLMSPQITSTGGATPTAEVSEEHTTEEHEPAPQEMTYRSVRAAPSAGRIWNDLSKDPKNWEAAKAVMEGSGERG